jgi:hypothetical protein
MPMPRVRFPFATGAAVRAVAVAAVLGVAAPAALAAACAGDCDGDGDVTVDELLRTVAVALGDAPVAACPAAERNGDGSVAVDEILFAVQMALQGCPARSFRMGMNFASWWNGNFADPQSDAALDQLAATGVDTVVVVPTYYMDTSADAAVYAHPQKTESLASLAHVIGAARARGFRVVLKPHIDPLDGEWRGRIAPADVDAWFASYTGHMIDLAALGNAWGVDLFVVASELQSLEAIENHERWRALVASLKSVYGGDLAYAANWDGYQDVPFWDLVDVVGIQAYFPLSSGADPDLETLVQAWVGADGTGGWMGEIRSWHEAAFPAGTKELIFTEAGYVSSDWAMRRPWELEDDCFAASGGRPWNGDLQARGYEALLQSTDRLDGIFWWHWEPFPITDGTGQCRFTPQGRPAEALLSGG